MSTKNYSRRDFIGKTSAGLAGAATAAGMAPAFLNTESVAGNYAGFNFPASPFAAEVEKLPVEKIYDYHKHLTESPVHIWRRDKNAVQEKNEMSVPDNGWKITMHADSGIIVKNAVEDFRDYMDKSHGIKVETEPLETMKNWKKLKQRIVIGTRDQLPGCGEKLKGQKDYEIKVTPKQIVICGYDERGAMFGLYNLESRMNLREAPFLPKDLNVVRHSLFDTRMVLSWMGWMEFPDRLLSHLAHDGFDGIYVGVYTNPNGDRTIADNSTDFYARLMYRVRHQDPKRVRDVIDRAAKYGIKVYTPIIWQYMGTPESETGLRNLVKDIVTTFPDIKGYVLLTEGFWYKEWRHRGADKEAMKEWARNWCAAVKIVEDECHKIDPSIDILPWEYNINNRPQNVDIKEYFIEQLPDQVVPMPTWENGKSFELDDMKGHLTDYSLNQIGPAEVTIAQISLAKSRGMRVFTKVDTFASWQFGTVPYLPCPYQWYERYNALEKYGVNGTMESWSSGYKPNFISELRAWTCWTNGLSRDELLNALASRIFGSENKELVLKAWDHFSQAIRFVPDTGASMGTNNAVGNPLFFSEPEVRTATFNYSWSAGNSGVNPYWPFTVSRMVFYPDFTNRSNKAESYARGRSGVHAPPDRKILPVFLKYLGLANEQMEEGLKYYRKAAENSPEKKRTGAVKEVVVAEQMQRMMQSNFAILQFEDLRIQLSKAKDNLTFDQILDKLEMIMREEIYRTELSLLAATRDSRLGFQFEQDYVYTPYSLKEKLGVLREALNTEMPRARKRKSV
ncbi:MAG: hypothetical protein GX126_08135 [Bacteroidales bacterium]|nr:hypothetical protein [Bacteroidales bacterium]